MRWLVIVSAFAKLGLFYLLKKEFKSKNIRIISMKEIINKNNRRKYFFRVLVNSSIIEGYYTAGKYVRKKQVKKPELNIVKKIPG